MAVMDWDDYYDFYDSEEYSTDILQSQNKIIDELDDFFARLNDFDAYMAGNITWADEELESFWDSMTPRERRKSRHRLIPLGKWWHVWKRGKVQKDATLRTHRKPRALRHGKRKVFAQKNTLPPIFLETGEGIKAFCKFDFLHSGFCRVEVE